MRQAKSLKNLLLIHELTFIFLIALAGIAGTTAIRDWQQASQESLRINRLIQEIQQARGDLYRQMKELFDAYFLDDIHARAEYNDYTRKMSLHFERLRDMSRGQEELAAISSLQQGHENFLRETEDILQRYRSAPDERLRRVLNTELEAGVFAHYETVSSHAERLLDIKQQELQDNLTAAQHTTLLLLTIPVALAVLLLIFSRVFLQHAIARPISDILYATTEISAGRLEHKAPESRTSELSTLASAINRMASDLARSQKALMVSEKQAAQGALVPMLAHNIRNPLASIRATAQVADSPLLDEETRESLRDIIGTVDRLERWTSSLLAYLHPLRPQLTACRLPSIMNGAVSLLQQKLAERSITLNLPQKYRPDTLVTDEYLLEQALYNLLLNAVDASPSGGTVEIRHHSGSEGLQLQILDRGPGMPFTPSADQSGPGPSTKRMGTGLGLPFAFKVCESLGGRLHFSTRPGGGTEVILWLPHQTRATAAEA